MTGEWSHYAFSDCHLSARKYLRSGGTLNRYWLELRSDTQFNAKSDISRGYYSSSHQIHLDIGHCEDTR